MKKLIQIMILLSISLYNGLMADEPIRKFSEFTLAQNDTLKNDVIVFKGDAKIDGFIQGNLSVYAGDIYLGKNSSVTGEIKAYAGKVYRDEKVDEASSYYIVNKLKGFVFRDPSDGIELDDLDVDHGNFDISFNVDNKKYYNFFSRREVLPRSFFSYTKAEGLYLGLGSDMNFFKKDYLDLGIFATGGYAFREKEWKFYLQEQIGFYKQNFVLGAVQYDNTLTEDGWKLDFDLNSLAAVTIHEDFYNYYGSTGYGFYTGSALHFSPGDIPFNIGWKASYYHDKIREMDNATNYSLFTNTKDFAPAMQLNREGNMKTVNTTVFMGIGKKKSNELQMAGIFETTLNSAEQDFRYEKVIGTLTGRVQLGEFFYLSEKFRMESSSAYSNDTSRSVPNFKFTSLGGTGTLPGYSLNSIWGNKAIISRTTLGFSESHLKDLCFMLDIGDAWSYSSNDLLSGFDKISLNQMKKSFGIGYLLGKHMMFSVHKRLDTGHNPYQMQLTSNMSIDEILNFRQRRDKDVKKMKFESIIEDVEDGLDNVDDSPKTHKKKIKKMKFKWDDKDKSDEFDDEDKKFFDQDEEPQEKQDEPLKKSEE